MRVLVVAINYAPEIISTGLYTTGLCEFLADAGHEVEVVTSHPYYPEWRTHDGWGGLRWRREIRNGVRVTHCPIYVPARPSGLKRIIHNLSFALSAAPSVLWHAARKRPDCVIAVAPTLMSAPLAALAARVSGGASWLHVQDMEIDAAFATGLLRKRSAVGRLALGFEGWVLRRFSRVSTISPQMLRRLVEKGVPPEKTFEFRNWADVSAVKPLEAVSPLKDEYGIEARHVALYSGNLGNKQGLETIVEVARKLQAHKDLTFVIAGDGPMRTTLEALGAGLPNLRFLPLQPIDRLGDLLGMADIHLLPQVAGAADLVLPSKLTNILASGRPVIATVAEGTGLWSEVQGVGLTVEPDDSEALSEAVLKLLGDSEMRGRLGQAARQRAVERWSKPKVLDGLLKELRELTGLNEAAEYGTNR